MSSVESDQHTKQLRQSNYVLSTRYLPCILAYKVFGSRGSDTRFKKYTRLLAFGLRRSLTRFKNTREFFFLSFYYVFLNTARAEIFRSEKYTLKEKYSLIEIRT